MTITVSCPSCDTSFPVDPAKVPPEGVRAQCSSCPEIFDVDPPNGAMPAVPPATDALDPNDPLASALTEPPPVEEVVEAPPMPMLDPEPVPVAAEAAPAEEAPAASGAIRFGRRTAEDKAKSLARSLVSDLIAYNPDKHKEALAAGTLPEVFGEEIDKSFKEYQEQVEADVIAKGTFFNDALNSILAEDASIFSLDA